jgi:hypothetical protein
LGIGQRSRAAYRGRQPASVHPERPLHGPISHASRLNARPCLTSLTSLRSSPCRYSSAAFGPEKMDHAPPASAFASQEFSPSVASNSPGCSISCNVTTSISALQLPQCGEPFTAELRCPSSSPHRSRTSWYVSRTRHLIICVPVTAPVTDSQAIQQASTVEPLD